LGGAAACGWEGLMASVLEVGDDVVLWWVRYSPCMGRADVRDDALEDKLEYANLDGIGSKGVTWSSGMQGTSLPHRMNHMNHVCSHYLALDYA